MKIFELKPTSSRKSFYGKCKAVEEGGVSTLYSYDTPVAIYDHLENRVSFILEELTATTRRHVNAFLDFYGFEPLDRKTDLSKDIQGA